MKMEISYLHCLLNCFCIYFFFVKIRPYQWNYIAASYNYKSGAATLWRDSVPIAQRRVGRIRLATNAPVVIGWKMGDRRVFKGQISCIMLFGKALTGRELKGYEKKCFRRSKCKNIHCMAKKDREVYFQT